MNTTTLKKHRQAFLEQGFTPDESYRLTHLATHETQGKLFVSILNGTSYMDVDTGFFTTVRLLASVFDSYAGTMRRCLAKTEAWRRYAFAHPTETLDDAVEECKPIKLQGTALTIFKTLRVAKTLKEIVAVTGIRKQIVSKVLTSLNTNKYISLYFRREFGVRFAVCQVSQTKVEKVYQIAQGGKAKMAAYLLLEDKEKKDKVMDTNTSEIVYDLYKFVNEQLDRCEPNGMGIYHLPCPLHMGSKPHFYITENLSWGCFSCGKRGSGLDNLLTAIAQLTVDIPVGTYNGITIYQDTLDAWVENTVLYPYTADGIGLETGVVEAQRQIAQENQERRRKAYQAEVESTERYISGGEKPEGLQDVWGPDTHNRAMSYMYNHGFLSSTMNAQHVLAWDSGFSSHPLIFPLWYQDKVLGYQQRVIDQHEPKYMTVAGLEKQKWIFGNVPDGKHVILLCEGVTDRLMALQNGYAYVFMTLGAVLSSEQADLLERHASAVICAYHDDTAGNDGYRGVESHMAIRQIPVTRLKLPVKDIKLASSKMFHTAMDAALSEVRHG